MTWYRYRVEYILDNPGRHFFRNEVGYTDLPEPFNNWEQFEPFELMMAVRFGCRSRVLGYWDDPEIITQAA